MKAWFEYTIKTAEVVLATAALLIAVLLWNTTKEQVDEAKRATDSAYSAARQGMELTMKIDSVNNIATTKRDSVYVNAVHTDLRAYVVLDSIKFDLIRNKKFEFSANLKNVGKTPAHFVNSIAGASFFKPSEWKKKVGEFMRIDINQKPIGVTIGSGQTPIMVSFIPYGFDSPDTLIRFTKGELELFMYVSVVYKDVFKKSHHTHFCARVTSKEFYAQGTEEYNDAN